MPAAVIIGALVLGGLLLGTLVPRSVQAQQFFFESPRAVAGTQARFPQSLSDGQTLYLVYQESVRSGDEGGSLHIAVSRSADGVEWERLPQRIGPIAYGGSAEPFVFWAVTSGPDEIYIAVTESADRVGVYRSRDAAESFELVHTFATERTNVAPRLFAGAQGSLHLFMSQNVEGRQAIVHARSEQGTTWSDPVVLEPDAAVGLTFLPTYAHIDGVDLVVYQGLNIVQRTTYQLYRRISRDGGVTWEDAQRLTTFVDPTQTDNADLYDNQRPHVVAKPAGDGFVLAWERRFQTGSPQVYLMELDPDGGNTGLIEEVTGRLEVARAPMLVFWNNEPVLTYFTNPQGNSRVLLARRGRFRWESAGVSPAVGEAVFASPVVHRNRVHVSWQARTGPAGSNVVYLEPDQRVQPPTVQPVNFRLGERSNAPSAQFRLVDPSDASGIRGYSYVWSRDPEAEVPRTADPAAAGRQVSVVADADGRWYLRVRATDNAGNWSAPTTVAFFRDQTPPAAVRFPRPPVDENGYMDSNTFRVGWTPPDDEDVAGYAVRLDFLGSENAVALSAGSVPAPRPPGTQMATREPFLTRTNVQNGVWLLSVAAIDTVGNVGPAAALPLRFNKFVASTQVAAVGLERDPIGRYQLRVTGRGFTSDGEVTRVLLDQEGREPYAFEFLSRRGEFRVLDDQSIGGILIENVPPGSYRLGLDHPDRGLYWAPQPVRFEARGVIKYGDFRPVYVTEYRAAEDRGRVSAVGLWSVAVAAAAVLMMLVSSVRLVSIARDMRQIHHEARALIAREVVMTPELKERAKRMRKAGVGLRIKFAFFVVLLVIGVVVVVSVVLSRDVLQRQEELLAQGLQNRVELLVEGMVTGARPALQNPQLNIDQLQTLAGQAGAMDEALYVTLTGITGDQSSVHAVYATTDPAVTESLLSQGSRADAADGAAAAGGNQADGGDPAAAEPAQTAGPKIDTAVYTVGVSRLTDELTPELEELSVAMNAAARAALGGISQQLEQLSQQAQALILRGGATDAEIVRLDQARAELLRTASLTLAEIAGGVRSSPAFDSRQLRRDQTEFLFYKPVLDLIPGAGADFNAYYRGTVRLAISTQLLLDELAATQRDLIYTTIVVAVVAVVFGIIGAYVLATIVVIPIDKLVKVVERISATEDKAELKGLSIQLRSRDELNVLANTINEMTAGLVKAAEANRDLMFGKETQKMFIPLERLSDDRKRTTGEVRTGHAEFYGYYEGAKGVSGDYFSYQQLDERFFALIKCDVAGKGVPAALIMVQVATVFLDHFREWTLKRPGLNVASLVTRMNDLVAEREFKGRFAALTTGIVDTHTGALHLTNAGDNQLHIFRAAAGAVEQSSMSRTPAAGVFTSDFIPSGFPQERYDLAKGDILLLFTDGLEEAKRYYRDAAYSVYTLTEADVAPGGAVEGSQSGSDNEEFGIERIHSIVHAVNTRGTYSLVKVLDPAGEPLQFDFSGCDDPVRDTVLAIISIEKMFRVYRDPAGSADARINVDRTVVEFLERHFLQFGSFFGDRVTRDGDDTAEYITFARLREDEQYDDLTLLAVRRL